MISYNLRHFSPTAFLCVAVHAWWRHDSRRMPMIVISYNLRHFSPTAFLCEAVHAWWRHDSRRIPMIVISYNLRHFSPTAFLCEAVHAWWRHDSRRMPTKYTHRQTRTRSYKNYQINTFDKFESINSIILSLCISTSLFEVWIFNLWCEMGQLLGESQRRSSPCS